MHFNELDEDEISAIALPHLYTMGDHWSHGNHVNYMLEADLVAFVRDIESKIKARLAAMATTENEGGQADDL